LTEPPQGRGGSSSVAALAVQINRLRREFESLAAKVDEQAVAVDDIAELCQ
jgi:hypothetical protein